MDDKEYTAKSSKCMNILRKRLFILAAYILVSAILLAYVSYGQFKITLKGTTTLPAAEGFYASISLTENEDADEGKGADDAKILSPDLLAGLLPGDNAMAFSKDTSDTSHKLNLTVSPTEPSGTSSMDLEYTIRIYSDRSIPLQFVLVDPADSSKKYVSYYHKADKVYKFYDYEAYKVSSTAAADAEWVVAKYSKNTATPEKTFTVAVKDATPTPQNYTLYVGWDTTRDTANKYRKEVDVLKIGAQIIAREGTDNPAPATPGLPYNPTTP